MKQKANLLLSKWKQYWQNYVWQSIAATCGIAAVLTVFKINRSPIIIASLGATTFIIFAMPTDITAKGSHVIGGHLVGILTGLACSLLPDATITLSIVSLALAVGISLFIMVVIDTEHPPACGTALGIAHAGFDYITVASIIAAAVILSLIRILLKDRLKDLV